MTESIEARLRRLRAGPPKEPRSPSLFRKTSSLWGVEYMGVPIAASPNFNDPPHKVLEEFFRTFVGQRASEGTLDSIRAGIEQLIRDWLLWDAELDDQTLCAEVNAIGNVVEVEVWATPHTHEWLKDKGIEFPLRLHDYA